MEELNNFEDETPSMHRLTIANLKEIDNTIYISGESINFDKAFEILDEKGSKVFTINGLYKLIDSINLND